METTVPDANFSPTACQIRAALEQIAASSVFSKSSQLDSFLRFVVQETLAGRGERIKAYTIATSALGRNDDFDPQADPIVRVEAGRLRRALRQYYAKEGRDDPVIIELPVGRYMPAFRHNHGRAPAGSGLAPWRETIRSLRENRRMLLMVVVIAAIVAVTADLLGMLIMQKIWPIVEHAFRDGTPDLTPTGSLGK